MSLKPKVLTLLGDYWDITTLNNKLYIWGFDGSVICLDWKKLNKHLNTKEPMELKDLKECIVCRFDNPFKELHTDFDTFNNHIFAVLDDGLFYTSLDHDNKIVKERTSKIWDCPLFSLKIKANGRMALAGGEEGLFQYDVLNKKTGYINNFTNEHNSIDNISHEHSLLVDWAHSSIFSFSNKGDSFLAGFYWDKGEINYKGIIYESEIFGQKTHGEVSWAYRDKIYRTKENGLEYISFIQKNLQEKERQGAPFSTINQIRFMDYKGKPLYAGVSKFGSIIECENSLVVMENERSFLNIPQAPVRWRIYPEDTTFNNHLHVILEDKIQVYVF